MNIAFCLESTFNSGGMERMLSVIANAIGYSETVTVITAFNEGRTDYFSFDDIMRLAYWIGNFWTGVQYEINNHPEEIRVVEQRGLISPDDDAYKSQDRIVLIKRIVAVDKDGRPIEYPL